MTTKEARKKVIAIFNDSAAMEGNEPAFIEALDEFAVAHLAPSIERRRWYETQLEAQRRSWVDTIFAIKVAIAHIGEMDFGTAKRQLEALLEELPHDHGAQTFRPMIERHIERLNKTR